ncbi:MAG: hypothetical protein J6386_11980 [Candidatus Synoicihabitans palmerolidicus]|nr:hypothetical protein [Candidatus Synoicihabitans palmerolidicus]
MPEDGLIDDAERAQLLFRARMENGQLGEIAGVPAVTEGRTVFLANPRRLTDRIWWDASYPQGIPPYYGGGFDQFPSPGPGWGYPNRRN